MAKAHIMKIGIATPEQQRQRVLDIAAGRRQVKRGEPKIWFPSLKTAAEVLDRNRELIRLMHDEQPQSVQELAQMSGRAESNVSRSLKRLEAYGIVRMVKAGRQRRPEALARELIFEWSVDSSALSHATNRKRSSPAFRHSWPAHRVRLRRARDLRPA